MKMHTNLPIYSLHAYFKGAMFVKNVNIENQQETCLQIGTYVRLIISFLIQITLMIVFGIVTSRDKLFCPGVIKKTTVNSLLLMTWLL